MFIGQVTAQQVSTVIWNATRRSLTTAAAIVAQNQVSLTSVAASTSVLVTPASGHLREVTVCVDNVAVHIGLFDGVNTLTGVPVAGLPYLVIASQLNSASFVNSDGVNAHNYMYTYLDWNIT